MSVPALNNYGEQNPRTTDEALENFSNFVTSGCDISSSSFSGGDPITKFFKDLISGKFQNGVIKVEVHRPKPK
jgi:hypothetical protein